VLPASFESRSANMSGGTFSLHPTTNYNAPHRAKSYTFYTLKKGRRDRGVLNANWIFDLSAQLNAIRESAKPFGDGVGGC